MKYTVLDTVLDIVKFQATKTQLESHIETLRTTVAMLNYRIDELQETLSQVRGKVTQLKDDDISNSGYSEFDISNMEIH